MFDRRRALLTMAAGVASMGGLPGCAKSGKPVTGGADPRLAEYEMPLETAPHERTFMQWPVSLEAYDRAALARVQQKIALIANTIAEFEPVVMLAAGDQAKAARAQLGQAVEIWNIPADDLWCRDSGPTFVKNSSGDLAVAHIRFNGWGNKQAHSRDGRIAAAVADRLGLPLLETGLTGEQGGVEHDGAGTLLAHASCWVNPNRNRGTPAAIGELLLGALGGETMIWAPGIKGADITDYHIDALARFVSPGRVLIQMPGRSDPNDPWSVSALETLDILKRAKDASGKPLDIVQIDEPVSIRSRQTDFVASYVNYYACNGAVIGAEFGDRAADEKAAAMLASLFPGREIVSLNVDAIGESGGGIHCATQQQPKAG